MRARQIIAQIKNVFMNCFNENEPARQIIEGNTLSTEEKKIDSHNILIKYNSRIHIY